MLRWIKKKYRLYKNPCYPWEYLRKNFNKAMVDIASEGYEEFYLVIHNAHFRNFCKDLNKDKQAARNLKSILEQKERIK